MSVGEVFYSARLDWTVGDDRSSWTYLFVNLTYKDGSKNNLKDSKYYMDWVNALANVDLINSHSYIVLL